MPSGSTEAVRIGVVGGGLIAQVAHLPALRALDDQFEIVALADPSPAVRETLARRYAVPRAFATHEAMLEATELDAVLICSPAGAHGRATLDALDLRLHVLVEKPLCLTGGDAAAIVRRAEETRLTVQVGYMKRFDPAYEALLALSSGGGALRHANAVTVDPGIGDYLRPAGFVAATGVDASRARTLRDATAAQVASAVGSDDPQHVAPFCDAFLGALIHDVNLLLGLLDAAGESTARVVDARVESDGTLAHGAWATAGGARWSATWMLLPAAARFCEDIRLFADDGVRSLRFPAPYFGAAPTELRVESGACARRWPPADCYARALAHFHECVTDGVSCRAPAGQAARDIAVLTELYRTAVAA